MKHEPGRSARLEWCQTFTSIWYCQKLHCAKQVSHIVYRVSIYNILVREKTHQPLPNGGHIIDCFCRLFTKIWCHDLLLGKLLLPWHLVSLHWTSLDDSALGIEGLKGKPREVDNDLRSTKKHWHSSTEIGTVLRKAPIKSNSSPFLDSKTESSPVSPKILNLSFESQCRTWIFVNKTCHIQCHLLLQGKMTF